MRIGQLTAEDMQRGFIVCNCGKYAYVFSGHVLAKLPGGQVGELCAECGAYMVRVEKLREAGFDVPANSEGESRAASARTLHPLVRNSDSEKGQ